MNTTASATKAGPERKTLVAITIERELDLFQKSWEEKVFVKLYVAARTSGLLAAITDCDWKTLCTLATFMDKDGKCYPSQAKLARSLGISRASANARIQSLSRFHFDGKPVLVVEKQHRRSRLGHRFAANRYTILPVTQLKIFDRNGESARPARNSPV
jgi:biotin operon repressor